MLQKIILSSLLLVLATGFAWSQTPVISAKNAGTQCSGVTFFVVPVNGTDIVPAGTTYSWPSPIITGSITGAGAASNMTNISGTLSTTTIAARSAPPLRAASGKGASSARACHLGGARPA